MKEFSKDLVKSKLETEKLMNFLKDHKSFKAFKNVEDDKRFQDADIDFLVKIKGKVKSVEVKVDSYTSGNFFFELISNVKADTLGCVFKSKADFWFYYFSNYKKVYIFKTKDMQEYVKLNRNNYRVSDVANSGEGNRENYYTRGLIVPIKDFINSVKVNVIDMEAKPKEKKKVRNKRIFESKEV